MEPSQFFFIILPLAIIIAILIVVVFYLSRKTEETDYEKEMKNLRKLLLKGKLDRQQFLHIRDNLKVEDLFVDETKRLDDMLKHKKLDSDTYVRLKKILEMSFGERLEKIEKKYNFVKPTV
jgi:nitrogen fixation-related uncharacterized protein